MIDRYETVEAGGCAPPILVGSDSGSPTPRRGSSITDLLAGLDAHAASFGDLHGTLDLRRMIERAAAVIREQGDTIEGLTCDLFNAVETAFDRGAVGWAALNYPKWFDSLIANQAARDVSESTEAQTNNGLNQENPNP